MNQFFEVQNLPPAFDRLLDILPPDRRLEAARHLHRAQCGDRWATGADLIWVSYDAGGRPGTTGILDIWHGVARVGVDLPGSSGVAQLLAAGAIPDPSASPAMLSADRQTLIWAARDANDGSIARPRGGSSVLAIHRDLFVQYVKALNPDASLTEAEAKTLLHLLGGLSWRKAAETDRVSVETKRKQFKTACAKLGESGQVPVAMRIMGQLSQLNGLRQAALRNEGALEAFAARFLAQDARLCSLQLPSGRRIRYLESGPAGGRPVLAFHGIAFPIILLQKAEQLRALNLRLITPVRRGYFEGPEDRSDAGSPESEADDAAALLDLLDVERTEVLGSGFGAGYATVFADRHPARCSRMIALTPFFKDARDPVDDPLSAVVDAFRGIDGRSQPFDEVIRSFTKYHADPDVLLRILDQLVCSSESDRSYLRQRIGGEPVCKILAEGYRVSMAGVAQDFQPALQIWPRRFGSLRCPIVIVRGAEDDITSKAICRALAAANPGARVVEVEGGGQFVESSPASRTAAWQAMFGES